MRLTDDSILRRVLVVGAGGIGSRHLQALAVSTAIGEVYAIEPRSEARDLASQRWEQSAALATRKLTFVTLDQIHFIPDAVILATPAMGRIDLLGRLLELGTKRILSEKVFAQRVVDIDRALELEASHGARIWLNQVYRYSPVFKAIRAVAAGASIRMDVKVGGDGMGCNLIHFLDLFEFVSADRIAELDVHVDLPVHASKRGGELVEFTGRAEARGGAGSQFVCAYQEGESHPPVITLSWGSSEVCVSEQDGSITGQVGDLPPYFAAPRVSELSAQALVDCAAGQALMPRLSETASLNRLMLAAFNQALAGRHSDDLTCPVT
jgi:predicted dehydrogenase